MMPNMISIHFKLILLLLALPRFVITCLAIKPITNFTTDQLALLALKDHITEPTSRQILAKNWTRDSFVCDWIGVTCGSRHLRVTALDLSNMKLTGTITPHLGNLSFLVYINMSVNHFQGELPDEFSRLHRLKVFDLSHNNLNGQFPPWIGSFQRLRHLNIWNNSFRGVIPQSISNLSKLTMIDASHNDLEGKIPGEIFNISSLVTIYLNHNGFSAGSLQDDMCRNLPKLKGLDLGQTGLIGKIPSSIGNCLQLQGLYLTGNLLTGEIPREIGNLMKLQELGLVKNRLEGSIPKEIGNLSMLQGLDFDYNNLTGTIPQEIGKLLNLQRLNFGGSKLIGSIPANIFNISTMTMLSFAENHLYGHLPSTMCYTLPNLEVFLLTTNHISGVIPESISNCTNLAFLDISRNDFIGQIPNSIGDLRLLDTLNLAVNNLTSDPSSPTLNFITSLVNCKFLEEINLSGNRLDGVLPDSVGNLSSTLQNILADNCKIKGTIPSGIGNFSILNTLDLSDNQLIGSLPSSIKNLQNVQRIYFDGDKMNVSLNIFCSCQNLGVLYLGGNLIVGGAIPDCLGNISSMNELHLDATGLSSKIPASLWNLNNLLVLNLSSNWLSGSLSVEIRNLKAAISMDFSRNHFSGEIPSSIGDLDNLQTLSLAHNYLHGRIPEATGKMLSLEGLDLSYNFLSGSLPMSLGKLQYLTSFNVSFNNLSGEIPLQGPFRNLTAKSFISNQALCGPQRFLVPPCQNLSIHHGLSRIHKVVIILVAAISVAGIMCTGFIHLRYRRSIGKTTNNSREGFPLVTRKRISYFELLRATHGYDQSNLLGSGSFGSVYKGTLDDDVIVAVKVFKSQLEGSFKSFDTECEVLRNLRHRNLIQVISSCSNPDFKALVLEYMPNGNLDSWLHSNNYFLSAMQRLNILIDVACALQYLHSGNVRPIVHCDLKPSNILLDQEMVAHVSDFGISQLLGQEDSITYTNTLATLCYVAPGEISYSDLMFLKLRALIDQIIRRKMISTMTENSERK